jgi:hypothetical protein
VSEASATGQALKKIRTFEPAQKACGFTSLYSVRVDVLMPFFETFSDESASSNGRLVTFQPLSLWAAVFGSFKELKLLRAPATIQGSAVSLEHCQCRSESEGSHRQED